MAFIESPWHLTTFALVFSCLFMCSHQATESEILLKFKDSLVNTAPLSNWNTSINTPCTKDKGNWVKGNWVGVVCSDGKVLGLQLENMSLSGIIDIDSLAGLPLLRMLNFVNNNLDGPFPNLKKLGPLKSVYLSNNKFSGEIPDDAFVGMGSLKKLYLSNNQFTGKIPSSLLRPSKLLELRLDGNKFEGRIPDFQQKGLKSVNLANNQLEGPIPARLSKMSKKLFSGNENLCGKPLEGCGKTSYALIIIIVIVVLIALGLLGAVFIILKKRNEEIHRSGSVKLPKKVDDGDKMELGANDNPAPKKAASEQAGKLIFVRDDKQRFDLQDLLRASAEVLGSGSFGSSYKAVLLTGPSVVVKRFRHMNNVGREEFQEHMRRFGRLSHPNLLSLVSYYYRKEEKLLVHDFVENGSLAFQLHGNRTADRPGLDWPRRLKIVKGVARGLVYLYNELPSLIVPHGHLKSSNVLLNESFDPLLTDYALVPLINQEHATQLMVAYKSPEYTQFGRTTKKTDVWSFGILILEMMTGKFPANYLKQVKGADNGDLASWVHSVVKDEWSTEVFDKDMKNTQNGEEEMLKLLKIGLGCCEDVEKRWDMKEALDKIEELKERNSTYDHDSSSSYSSTEGDGEDHGFSIPMKS